jgi:hypothetical protein
VQLKDARLILLYAAPSPSHPWTGAHGRSIMVASNGAKPKEQLYVMDAGHIGKFNIYLSSRLARIHGEFT